MRVLRELVLLLFLIIMAPCNSMAQDKQQFRDSLRAATELLDCFPDSAGLRLRKAAWNIRLEQWAYAKDEYDKVLSARPMDIAAHYFRAFVNEKLNRLDFARLDYEAVLAVVPGNFEASLGLALLNFKDSHFTEAMNMVNVLISQHPDSAVTYAVRAGFEKEKEKYGLAEYDYREAIRRDNSNIDYRLNLVDVLLAMRRRDEAIAELDNIVRLGVPKGTLLSLYRRARKM